MTPLERAEQLATTFCTERELPLVDKEMLAYQIHQVIIAEANSEIEKRRAVEAQLANVQAGGPVIHCDERGARLKVWHPTLKCWFETSMIREGETPK